MNANIDTTARPAETTAFSILLAISVSHLLNDTIQSLVPAIYPVLKESFQLDYSQIGLITLVFHITSSVFQPVVGLVTDRRPLPYSLTIGMGVSLGGLIVLSLSPNYAMVVLSAALIGLGSAVFHPESARVARMASGGRHGLAQSIFQIGGNVGSAIGPLIAAAIVVPYGQSSFAWFSLLALAAMALLWNVGGWYARRPHQPAARRAAAAGQRRGATQSVGIILAMLGFLVFSKYFYTSSFTSFYPLYLIETFGVSIPHAQLLLFLFLAAFAVGVLVGGPIGDRFGRKYVILGSIFGVLPFALLLPHANLFWTAVLTVPIGVILASAFPAILVYGQELLPGRIGMISGLFFGFAFGMGGIGAAVLGVAADHFGLATVYLMCSFLPAIGIIAAFLPDIRRRS